MKKILVVTGVFCLIIFIPYFIICLMNGFKFDNNNWEGGDWLFYLIQVVILGCLVGYTLEENKLL